jgi:electron transfer flavoprotein beta subunit
MTKPFRILVGCKRVIDYAVRIRVKADGSGVETANIKHSLNPFDEIALEESLKLREKLGPSVVKEIIAVSCGPQQCQEVLRTALAKGADRAIHVTTKEGTQPLLISRILEKLINREQDVGIVLVGKQAIDDDSNQTGQILAGMLNWPQQTFASTVQVEGDKVVVTREIEAGLETVSSSMPTVITTDLRLNVPRYATLQNIMKAKSKKIQEETLESLGIQFTETINNLKTSEPSKRKSGLILADVNELVTKMKDLK